VRLLGEPVHRLRHAVEEEGFRLLLAAVAVGRGDQLLGLGDGERGEEIGEDGPQRATQPDVEEVRKVGVADVVVVGRVGGDERIGANRLTRRINLLRSAETCTIASRYSFNTLGGSSDSADEAARTMQ